MKECFVCAACCYYCPNSELYELGEAEIKCDECYHNSGDCVDCLFEKSKECPEFKEGENV